MIMYTKNACPYCDRAKLYFTSHGLEYTLRTIGVDISLEDFKSKYPEVRTMPFILQDESTPIGGYSDLIRFRQAQTSVQGLSL